MSDEFATYKPRLGDQRLLGDKPHEGVSIETLALFDHDYLGNHAYVQYWDHRAADPTWQWTLLGTYSETSWVWRSVHDWGTHQPTFAKVGARVDLYLTSPRELRFLLR